MGINIKGIDKAELLAALFNNSKPLEMGSFDPLSSLPMTKEQAQTHLLQGNMSFDYLNGRVMKIDISGDEMESQLYDKDNGEGAANRVVELIRKSNALSSQMNTNQNPKIIAITDIKELSQHIYPARYQFKIKYEDDTEETETLSGPELIKRYKQYIDPNDKNFKHLLEYEIWPKPELKILAITDIKEISGTSIPPDYRFKIQYEDGLVQNQSANGASVFWKKNTDHLSEEHNTLFSTYLSQYGDPFSDDPSEQKGSLGKTNSKESLITLLKSYKEERSKDPREYFHFYSFFTGYSRTQKLDAVQAVIDILEQGKGTLNPKQLKICYQGRIGDRIREWEKENHATLTQVAEKATSQLNPSQGG